jgi:hypothetical protein
LHNQNLKERLLLLTKSIYALSDPITGLVRYCGYTKKPLAKRLAGHLKLKPEDQSYRAHWIRQLMSQDIKPEIIRVFDWEEQEEDPLLWQLVEQVFIKAMREDGIRLTNSTDGGDGGHNPPPEVLEARGRKISIAMTGRPAHNKGIPGPLKGVPLGPMSEEHKAKLSAARKGKKFGPHSPERRAKIAARNAERNRTPEMREVSRRNGMANQGKTRTISEEVKANMRYGQKFRPYPNGKFLPDHLVPVFYKWLEAAA